MRSTAALILVLITPTAWSANWQSLSGKVDSLVEFDNRNFSNEIVAEQWFEAQYYEPEKKLNAAFNASWFAGEQTTRLKIRQFYLEKTFNSTRYKIGRMQRSDALGYYNLDGVVVNRSLSVGELQFYGGAPQRIEDYVSTDGELLIGVALNSYNLDKKINVFHTPFLVKKSRFSLQRLKNNAYKDLFGFGTSIERTKEAAKLPLTISTDFSVKLNSPHLETFNSLLETTNSMPGRIRLGASRFQPTQTSLSFRDRFYSLYSLGKQTTFRGSYDAKINRETTIAGSIRYIDHDASGAGYGVSLRTSFRQPQGLESELYWDYMQILDDRTLTVFLGGETPVNSTLKVAVGLALQGHEKVLTGENLALAGEFKAEYMIDSSLYVSANMMSVLNTHLNNEYRLAAKMTWYFDQRFRERLQ